MQILDTVDFTTFTEVDPNNRIAVAAGTVTATALTRNEDASVYKDYGAGRFGPGFVHDFEVTPQSADNYGLVVVWAVSNTVDDAKAWADASNQAVLVRVASSSAGAHIWRLLCTETVLGTTGAVAWVDGTTYYWRIDWTDTVTCRARVYSNAARTTLIDTMTVLTAADRSYRYLFPVNSYNDANAATITCSVSNLAISVISLPNTTGSSGAKGSDNTRPPTTNPVDSETALSGAELNTVSTDDATNITHNIAAPNGVGDVTRHDLGVNPIVLVNALVKGCGFSISGAPAVYATYLYASPGTGTWTLVGSHATVSKDTILADVTSYVYSTGGHYYVDLWACAAIGTTSSDITLYFAKCDYIYRYAYTDTVTVDVGSLASSSWGFGEIATVDVGASDSATWGATDTKTVDVGVINSLAWGAAESDTVDVGILPSLTPIYHLVETLTVDVGVLTTLVAAFHREYTIRRARLATLFPPDPKKAEEMTRWAREMRKTVDASLRRVHEELDRVYSYITELYDTVEP